MVSFQLLLPLLSFLTLLTWKAQTGPKPVRKKKMVSLGSKLVHVVRCIYLPYSADTGYAWVTVPTCTYPQSGEPKKGLQPAGNGERVGHRVTG